MHLLLQAADIAVTRAGGTIAELAALGVPSILVPLPIATRDHQLANARVLEARRRRRHDPRFRSGRRIAWNASCSRCSPTASGLAVDGRRRCVARADPTRPITWPPWSRSARVPDSSPRPSTCNVASPRAHRGHRRLWHERHRADPRHDGSRGDRYRRRRDGSRAAPPERLASASRSSRPPRCSLRRSHSSPT